MAASLGCTFPCRVRKTELWSEPPRYRRRGYFPSATSPWRKLCVWVAIVAFPVCERWRERVQRGSVRRMPRLSRALGLLLGAEGLGCAKAQGQCVRHLDFERPRMFAHYIHSASRKKQNAPCPKGYLSRRLIANGFVFVSPGSAGAQDERRHGLARHSAETGQPIVVRLPWRAERRAGTHYLMVDGD